jgi:hypothetical protein
MKQHNIHQDVYFSVSILAFVSASINAVMDPTVFHTQFAAAIVRYYSFTIAFLIIFYLVFMKYEDWLEDRLIRRYQKTIRRMLFLTALFLIVVMDPDLFGQNIVSSVVAHAVIIATLVYNTVSCVLLALSPWLQQTRFRRLDLMRRTMEHEERIKHRFAKKLNPS